MKIWVHLCQQSTHLPSSCTLSYGYTFEGSDRRGLFTQNILPGKFVWKTVTVEDPKVRPSEFCKLFPIILLLIFYFKGSFFCIKNIDPGKFRCKNSVGIFVSPIKATSKSHDLDNYSHFLKKLKAILWFFYIS